MESSPEVRLAALDAFETRFPFVLLVLDSAFDVEWASSATLRVLGHQPGELVGDSVLKLVHGDDLARLVPMAAAVVGTARHTLASPSVAGEVELPARLLHADGRWMPMAVSGRILDDEGRLLLCLRLAVDRHSFDAVLDCVASNADLPTTVEALLDLLRTQFAVEDAWFVRVSATAVLSDSPAPAAVTAHAAHVVEALRRDGPTRQPIVRDRHWIAPVLSSTGESLLGLMVLVAPNDDAPNAYDQHVLERTAGLASLAVSRIENDRLLHLAATTDPLTGLLNRRAFHREILGLAVTDGLPAAVLYGDVDGFKEINDAHGHTVGDEVLCTISRRLRGSVRPVDSVARLGGDEFAVVLPGVRDVQLDEAIARVAEGVSGRMRLSDGSQVDVRISFGGATAEVDDHLESVLRRADKAMYRTKRERRVS